MTDRRPSTFGLTLAALVALACSTFVSAQQDSPLTGQWAIHDAGTADHVELTLIRRSERSNMTSTSGLPLDQLRGLSRAQLSNSAGTAAQFQIVRDAGTLDCEGYLKNGHGGGTFRFTPNPSFISQMASLGYPGITSDKVFHMAVHDVSAAYVRGLQSVGVKPESEDQLLAMRIHNVTIEYIRAMQEGDYPNLTPDKLIAMRIHGVTPAFARDFRSLGYEPDADDLVAMRIHGVRPEFAKELRGMGYESVSIDNMVAMRIHGASSDFVKEIKGLGYQANVDQLIAMRIHGVTPRFIQDLRSRGMKDLTIDQLVSLRIHGIVD